MPKKKVTKAPPEIILPDDNATEQLIAELRKDMTPPDVVEVVDRAAPELVIEPVTASTPALSAEMVQVRNQGEPFACDLSGYGYGYRWPTNAVYTIPFNKYMELLGQGLDGVSA